MSDTGDALGLELASWNQLSHDVFLSYSWANAAEARRLHDRLSPHAKVFFAPNEIPLARQTEAQFQFAEILMAGLERSAHFVALLTPQYLESAWCELEMRGFANIVRRDRPRKAWLFELAPAAPALDAHLRGLRFVGDESELVDAVRRELATGARRAGDKLDGGLRRCVRELPLREMYRPPKRAPWKYDSQSRGLPGAPPYGVYEALVREYMVQIRRRGSEIVLEIPVQNLDERHRRLTIDARRDAQELSARGVDPFADRKSYGEISVELMWQLGEEGENEADLRGLAECRSYMGRESCEEALAIAERAIAAGVEASTYRRIRARAAYSLHRYEETIAIVSGDRGQLFVEDHLLLAAAHAQLGDAEAARRAATAALAIAPAFNRFDERLETRREDDEDVEHWLAGLERAGLP